MQKVVGMVYLGFPLNDDPAKVLKGFDKKELKKCKSTFKIFIDSHDLSYYDTTKKDYVRPTSGIFKVYVVQNSKNDSLTGNVNASY